jgi:hypothetical protein
LNNVSDTMQFRDFSSFAEHMARFWRRRTGNSDGVSCVDVGISSRWGESGREDAMRKIIMITCLAASLGACSSQREQDRAWTGAALGGVAGAVVGGATTGTAGGAVAGGAIGAAGGAMIGAATTPRQKCYRDAYGYRHCNTY